MKNTLGLLLLFSLLFSFCTLEKEVPISSKRTSKKLRTIAYVNRLEDNWGKEFEKAKHITHINYAFANIKDGKIVNGSPEDDATIRQLQQLKKVNPELKILISVGGWTWSKNFSDAVLTPASREIFAQSAIDFLKNHQLDGIDLDWEYPGLPGNGNTHRPEDKENFTAILKLIREKLNAYGKGKHSYLLTIATGASKAYLEQTNMAEAQKYLDFINIMTYDFHGAGENKTGHHANLFVSKYDDNAVTLCAATAVQQHLDAGIPANKLVLGVPFYGRWWHSVDSINNGCYQKRVIEGGGAYTYNFIADSLINKNGFQYHWDEKAKAPYLWRPTDGQFVTYENPKSLKIKVDFVKSKKLGGIMFWEFNGDNGELLATISEYLK
ncbi:MAG: glycoside hydrolase family 18 protein [Bacteroidota bacterium]